MQKEAFLVVISVLEGRNFPSRSKHHLLIECKFDGELLATDPVDHVEAPNFTTELAWEMDRKALHQHKMQRTPVKLRCFAVDNSTMVRENIGYILLDLRGAQQKPKSAKWYNLLSSKYSRLKPAIKIAMVLENDNVPAQAGFKASEAPPRPVEASGNKVTAVLNEGEAFFQVGPSRSSDEMYILSVTLGSAFHLEQLIYGEKALPSVHSGFFFYYSLFGSDITNDAFHNLLSPEITPERASIRVCSTLESLKSYFAQEPVLKVHLCCGDQVLGTASIPFSPLFTKKQLSIIGSEPLNVEGIYPLAPPINLTYAKAVQPGVSAAVGLRKESIPARADALPSELPNLPLSPETAPNEPPVRDTNHKPIPFPDLTEAANPAPRKKKENPKQEKVSDKTDQIASNTDDDATSIHSSSDQTFSDLPKPNMESIKDDKHSSLTTTETHTDVPAPMQHFRFTLDITAITTSKLPFPCNIFIKYSYPFFGSFSPVLTGAIDVKSHSEARIPRSKCVFDFACPPQLVVTTFRSYPVVLEVWHKDREMNDQMLGIANLVLTEVIKADRITFTCGDGVKEKAGIRQTCHGTVPVLTDTKEKIANLNVVTVLEDFGVVVDQNIIRPLEMQRPSPHKTRVPSRNTTPKKAPRPQEDPRQSEEYKTAFELELWKSQEKENFTARMKEMEVHHLKLLGEEFAKRDKERELLVSKQVSEYQALEKQLSNTMNDLEKREHQVSAAEQELNRLRDDAVREKDRAIAEAKEASKRMKDDCVHQVQLEREKRSLLEEHNKKLAKQVNELEQKYSTLMSQFYDLKKEESNRPEIRLQAELNQSKLMKTEVERKLESAVKSKLHYKQQWFRTLKELEMMKKREQDSALVRLKQQQQELETLKLRCLASDEKVALANDHNKLKQIQEDIQSMKTSKAVNQLSSIAIESCQAKSLDNDEINERISRLIEERDTLLRTGVYSQSDRIITELDRQIKEEMLRQQK